MKIALFSDTHLAAMTTDFVDNVRAVIAWINASDAALAVHLGDISADGVTHPAQLLEARAVVDAIEVPLLCLPGNHDIGDNPVDGLPLHEPAPTPKTLSHYRAAFGPDYWAQSAGDWTLIGLNAQLFGTGSTEETDQRAWLVEALHPVAGPVGLFLHKPWFRTALEDTERHSRYVPFETRHDLCDCFAAKDLRFVASGHTHQLRRSVVDGVEHFWVPSSAFVVPDRMQETIGEKIVGCAMLTLGETHRFDFVRPPGVRDHDLADYRDLFPQLRRVLGDDPRP